ncbi:Nucleoside-diphosphate-sugar epimerase [Geosmithia morbida]|uniref:Nucleoside-diphosphate-sugar epimerase n=1 Tax=Geosmithia morbida TaxID=1094350 RepID=A0A9P4YSW2_9HYPO|nr:Nucleoside-diphosphate-sugar epimerase [Geosmithia morbida]KAF4121450.1 Nucleoside-diphosphate-sugar epimerase [Geosmithia morbida]
MASYKKVALLGKGHLGSAVLHGLVEAGFDVSVLSRDVSGLKDLPSGVKAVQVDYSSEDSIVEALRGHDAAVSTVGFGALINQEPVIEACIKAGVKRYIPADWGTTTTDPDARSLPINAPFVRVQDLLKEKAAAGQLEWTIFSIGAFLEYVVDYNFVLDPQNHSIDLYDGGEHSFSSTRIATIGKAVASALKIPEKTKNRNLFVHDVVLTQAKVLASAKKYTPGVEWKVTRLNSSEELERAIKDIAANPTERKFAYAVLKASILGGKFRASYPEVDNELLGLPLLSDEEIDKIFAARFQKA